MIRHIVMWRLKDQALGNDKKTNAELAKQKLEALNGKIPGLIKLEVGIDFSLSPDAADLVLYSEFESREALDRYQSHPAHLAVVPFMKDVRADRRVVDYAVLD